MSSLNTSESSSTTSTKSLQSSSHWDSLNIDKSFSVQFLKPYSDDLIEKSWNSLITMMNNNASDEYKCRALDIATGTGLVAYSLYDKLNSEYCDDEQLRKKLSIDGVDYAVKMIDGAKLKLHNLLERNEGKIEPNLEFQVMDGQDLKFNDETFDVIYSNMGILFFPDISKGFSEMKRVLKSGGKAYISTWTRQLPIKAAFDLMEKQGRDISSLVKPVFSLSEVSVLESFGKQAGFSHVSVETISHSFVACAKECADFSILTISSSSIWKSKEEIQEFKQDLLEELQRHSDENGMIKIDILAHVAVLTK